MATPPHETALELEYERVRTARIVERSVSREVGEIDGDRSRTLIARDGRRVTVTVEAADLVALRAATNTWLSLVDVAERCVALVE